MKKVIFIGILSILIFSAFGQNSTDSIEIKKQFGTVFRQNGKNLTPNQLITVTSSNPDAYKEMKIAKSNYGAGMVLAYAGGFLVGWPIGTAIGGGDPNWALAGIGAGLIAGSIAFTSAYTNHTKKAVTIYNNGLKQTGFYNIKFNVGLTCSGVGVTIKF